MLLPVTCKRNSPKLRSSSAAIPHFNLPAIEPATDIRDRA
jgi:hypothetical protein